MPENWWNQNTDRQPVFAKKCYQPQKNNNRLYRCIPFIHIKRIHSCLYISTDLWWQFPQHNLEYCDKNTTTTNTFLYLLCGCSAWIALHPVWPASSHCCSWWRGLRAVWGSWWGSVHSGPSTSSLWCWNGRLVTLNTWFLCRVCKESRLCS